MEAINQALQTQGQVPTAPKKQYELTWNELITAAKNTKDLFQTKEELDTFIEGVKKNNANPITDAQVDELRNALDPSHIDGQTIVDYSGWLGEGAKNFNNKMKNLKEGFENDSSQGFDETLKEIEYTLQNSKLEERLKKMN